MTRIKEQDVDSKPKHGDAGNPEAVADSTYQGRKVSLNKPMPGDVKKYKVFVRNDKGRVVKVNFGDKNAEIKRDDPERRKNFRARHSCDDSAQAKDRTTARYWACRFWEKGKTVSQLLDDTKRPKKGD